MAKDLKATVLDYRLIREAVEGKHGINEELGYENPNRAFIALILRHRFGLEDSEIEEAIVDGKHDFGVDAVVIDTDEDLERPKVYLINSKYFQVEEKFDRSFPAGDLSKLTSATEALCLNPFKSRSYVNQDVEEKARDINSLDENPEVILVTLSNSLPPDSKGIDLIKDWISKFSRGGDFLKHEGLHLTEIANLLAPERKRKIDAKLELKGHYFEFSSGSAKSVVGRVLATDIASLVNTEGEDLFDKNVRGYAQSRNPVNLEIAQSAGDPDTGGDFFLLNNGITIVCQSVDYLSKTESPTLDLEDMQIVNGGQTARTLARVSKEGKLGDRVALLVKVIQTEDKKLLEKITEATNNQIPVRARDLRSNDAIQRKVERILEKKGYYYEARKDKYKGKVPNPKRIDSEKAAQAYYSYVIQKPADAKNKKRHLFGSLYYDIFHEEIDIEWLLFATLLLRRIEKLNKKTKETPKFSFVTYFAFHALALFKTLGITERGELSDERDIEAKHELIVKAMREVVEEELKEKGDAYSHRAFSIHPSTLGRFSERLKERMAGKKA